MITHFLVEPTEKIDWIDEINKRGITGYSMEGSYISKILVSLIHL